MVAVARTGETHSPGTKEGTDPVRVLDDPARVRAALTPLRRRVLRELRQPDSATGLAPRLGVSRQKLAYHLRVLEELGLLSLVEERQRRGCRERLLQTSARTLVVAPELLGDASIDPEERQDRFSSAYLIAASARTVGDVAALRDEAREAGKRLATMTQEAEIHFASPRRMRDFTDDLAAALSELAARYHRPDAADPRPYRLMVGMHPERRSGDDSSPASPLEGDEQ